jgi:predicted RNA methylase
MWLAIDNGLNGDKSYLTTMEDLFPLKEGIDYSKLKITQEGSFSITRRRDAERIMNIITFIVKNLNEKIITDLTACCGGDTINFGLHFQRVHSVEKEKENFQALKNNIEVYKFDNVSCYNEDSVTFYDWYSDVIFIDPPWGGPNYKETKKLDIELSGKRLDKWIEEILLRKTRPRHIFLKLPSNYNFDRLNFLSNTNFVKAYQIRSYILIHISVHLPEKRIQ